MSVTVHDPASDGSDAVEINIRDNGCGVSEKDLERIFEPFEHGDTPRFSLVGAGSGLGLALSKAYVNQIGGTLEVESEAGRGSTFTILVPEG